MTAVVVDVVVVAEVRETRGVVLALQLVRSGLGQDAQI